jgi:hypothetical protein
MVVAARYADRMIVYSPVGNLRKNRFEKKPTNRRANLHRIPLMMIGDKAGWNDKIWGVNGTEGELQKNETFVFDSQDP